MKYKPVRIIFLTAGLSLALLIAGCSAGNSTQQAASEAGEAPAAVAPTSAPGSGQADGSTNSQAGSQAVGFSKLNLNTAAADEFLSVPGVGARMVREFMEYRPYASILQFRREIGKYIDAEQVAAYEVSVYVPV